MPTAHLICGLPCAGKTTYALGLRADRERVLFSLDRWLITLFGRYAIADVGQEEHTRRVLACRELIWAAAGELLRRGADVILDDGFFLRQHRLLCVAAMRAAGAATVIHHLDAPLDLLRVRLEGRNACLPSHNFNIAPPLLEQFIKMFDPPSPDEGAELIVVRSPVEPALA